MRIFLSWSGEEAKSVGGALKFFLEVVFPGHVDAFLSDADIAPGQRFEQVIANNLDDASLGIILLTPSNMASPWLLFEAGALASKSVTGAAIPVLLGVERHSVAPPLNQFQNVVGADEAGFRDICTRIRESVSMPDPSFESLFTVHWPTLSQAIDDAINSVGAQTPHRRPIEDVADEILLTVTALNRQMRRDVRARGATTVHYRDPVDHVVTDVVNALGGTKTFRWSKRVSPDGPVTSIEATELLPDASRLQDALAIAIEAKRLIIIRTAEGDFRLDPRLRAVSPLLPGPVTTAAEDGQAGGDDSEP